MKATILEKVKITPHTHCKVCGKSVPLKKEFCSVECRIKEEKTQRRTKRMSRFFMLAMVLVLVMLMVSNLFFFTPPG